MKEVLIAVILFALFVAVFFFSFKLFHNRYIKGYRQEIDEMFKRYELTFVKKSRPRRADWSTSPFKKPPVLSLSLGQVMNMPISQSKYYIIQTKEGVNIWLEVETTFLSKPKLRFKKELLRKQPKRPATVEVESRNECPACHHPLTGNEATCPDCELSLK